MPAMIQNVCSSSRCRGKSHVQVRPGSVLVAIVAGLSLLVASASGGVVFTNLYSFTGYSDGCFPFGSLMQASDGKLYGTAEWGGSRYSISGYGTVFQLALDGTFNLLYQFLNNGDGDHPDRSTIVEGPDGYLYGTTVIGGYYHDGAVYVVSPDGFVFPIYSFSPTCGDGTGPCGGLALGSDGNLYGTASTGGAYGFGTIFQITADWYYRRLFTFDGTNGARPYGRLVQGQDGCLYGTTFSGGSAFQGRDTSGNPTGYGTVFKITTNGALTSLFSFTGGNGAALTSGLVQGRDGNLYGTTELGGAFSYGTVFKLTPDGAFMSLFSFKAGTEGAYPVASLTQGSDGNLHGTTADIPYINNSGGSSVGTGTIFRITPAGRLTKVYSFPGGSGGTEPLSQLLQASDGSFYGTCQGAVPGFGMIYRLTVPLEPVIQAAQMAGSGFSLKWSAVAGQSYRVQYSTNLGANRWFDLGTPICATTGVMSASDTTSGAQRCYRVVLIP
jgi:uncharacterized repeat protein (TIGR03803 family)